MQPIRTLATLVAGAALVAGCLCVAGCSADDAPATTSAVSYSTGDLIAAASSAGVDKDDVAAVVEGRVITQQAVDAQEHLQRVADGLADDDAFQSYLTNAGLTEWDVRREAIARLVENTIVELEAERRGIEVTDEDVSEAIQELESRYPSRSSWLEALRASGYDEESYANAVRASMLSSRLQAAVVEDYEPTKEQVEQYAVAFAPTLAGRRSSMILFSQDDYDLAEEVRQQILDGADFAEMAQEYSIDGTASQGGDVGWDSLSSFVPEYEEALDQLEPGEVSPVVSTRFGYHIILCTERYQPSYEADGSIDLDAIPADLMDIIVSSMKANLAGDEFNQYLADLESKATIAVFDEDGVQVPLEEFGLMEKQASESADEPLVADDGEDVIAATGAQNDTVLNAPEDQQTALVPAPNQTAAVSEGLTQD